MISDYLARLQEKLRQMAAMIAEHSIEWEQDEEVGMGLVKGRIAFVDSSVVVFAAHLGRAAPRYRFHYMDAENRLLYRWDSAPHHPEVATFPYHRHLASGVEPSEPVSIFDVLNSIEELLLI